MEMIKLQGAEKDGFSYMELALIPQKEWDGMQYTSEDPTDPSVRIATLPGQGTTLSMENIHFLIIPERKKCKTYAIWCNGKIVGYCDIPPCVRQKANTAKNAVFYFGPDRRAIEERKAQGLSEETEKNFFTASFSCFEGFVVLLDRKEKEDTVYMGKEENCDISNNWYDNYDESLVEVSKNPLVYQLLCKGDFSVSQRKMVEEGLFSDEDYAELHRLFFEGKLTPFEIYEKADKKFDGQSFGYPFY